MGTQQSRFLARAGLAALVLAACSVPTPKQTPGDGSGGPTTLAVSSPSYDFGTVVANTTSAVAGITVTNAGTQGSDVVSSVKLAGSDAAQYKLDVDGCTGHVLAPAQSCTVRVLIVPTTPGSPAATLTIAGNPGGSVSVALSAMVVAPGALKIQPNMEDFGGTVPNSATSDVTFTATNTGGSASGTISAAALSGSDAAQFTIASDKCAGKNLAAGDTCTVAVHFAPSAVGTKAATLSISAGNDTGVATLGGKALAPPQLAVTPGNDDFSMVNVNTATATHAFTYSNTGELPTGALAISLSGGDAAQFQISSDGCSTMTLAPGASCVVQVAFAPTALGVQSAVLAASASPGGSANADLTGTSIAPADLVFTPPNNNFGNQDVGTASVEASFMVQNTGTVSSSAITASLGGTDADQFHIVSDGCTGQTLAASATCTITVSFAPTVYGAKSATLVAQADAGGTAIASLSGVGRDKLTLTVLTSGGTGSGQVSPSSGALGCLGTVCTGQYYRGTTVTLAATPDAGMVFRGWSGACTASPCQVTLDSNQTVTAAFDIAYAQLAVAPMTDDFGQVVVGGTTVPHAYKVTNTGNIASGTIATSLGGANASQFVKSSDGCAGTALAPGASCSIGVSFAPGATGMQNATVTATATPGGSTSTAITGTGLAPAAIAFQQQSASFGIEDVGTTSGSISLTLLNSGGVATSTLSASIGGTNPGDFTITGDTCSGHTLAPAATCTVSIAFAPTVYGSRSATLLASASTGGTAAVALGGTGRDQVTLTVNLAGNGTGAIAPTQVSPTSGQVGAFTCTAAACSGQFYRGTVVTLSAFPNGGMLFAGWGAGACAGSGTGTCAGLTLSQDTTATASFVVAVATLAVSPTAADLGQVVINGTGSIVSFTFSNTGTIATGTPSVALGGTDAGQFAIASNGCTGAIAPGGSCIVQAYFAPTSAGARTATLKATASPGGSATSTLTATGLVAASLAFTPASNDYGNQDVGTASAAVTFMLQNSGTQPTTTITTSMVGANPGDFTIVSDGCNNQMLGANGTCSVSVKFAPTAYGSRAASLRASATTGGVATSSLAGFGRDKFTLTTQTAGDGTGTISANPQPLAGNFSCTGTTCTGSYYRGTVVALTATPAGSSVFGGWSASCTVDPNTGACSVTMGANTSVTATFLGHQDLLYATSGGTGVGISFSPSGVSCGSGCMRYVTGTNVTLTATPSAMMYLYFASWSGDCTGTGPTCALTMSTGHNVTATFAPPNRVFVTSTAQVPPAGAGVAWADGVCQQAAAAAGLQGTFISYWGGSAWSTRLGTASGWVRMDGKPFAATKADLINGHTLYPIRVTETGGTVPANQFVNTNATGNNCSGWTLTSGNQTTNYSGVAGSAFAYSGTYSVYQFPPACGTALPLYCFQTDHAVTVTYTPAPGRIAFATSGFLTMGGGVAGLDAACNSRAQAANLPGTYRALVATTTATAASRLSTMGAPWVRTDGIALVANAADLFATTPAMLAPLDIDENKNTAFFLAAGGAQDVNTIGTVSSTCNNYTVSAAGMYSPMSGVNDYTTGTFFFGTYYGCDGNAYTAYCLQQ